MSKFFRKQDKFEVISPKIQSQILEKLVKKYSKKYEESEGLDSTNGAVDTTFEEELDKLTGLASDKKIFLRNLSKLI